MNVSVWALAMSATVCAAPAVLAQAGDDGPPAFLLFDIDADPGGWAAAIECKAVSNAYDFDLDMDYGTGSFIPAPLTSAGSPPLVAPGRLPEKMSIGAEAGGPGGPPVPALWLWGPSAGLPSNGVHNLNPLEALNVSFDEPKCAYEFNAALAFVGFSALVDIHVSDQNGNVTVFPAVPMDSSGRRLGIVGAGLSQVWLHDPIGISPTGIQGHGATYVETQLGTVVCTPANANSTGAPAQISATGCCFSPTLHVSGLPLDKNGYFLASDAIRMTPFSPPGSEGLFCLGGGDNLGRYSGNVLNSGITGQVSLDIDPVAVPWAGGMGQGNPPTIDVTGQTWYFSYWYRDDTAAGGETTNFSDAICIDFFCGKKKK